MSSVLEFVISLAIDEDVNVRELCLCVEEQWGIIK